MCKKESMRNIIWNIYLFVFALLPMSGVYVIVTRMPSIDVGVIIGEIFLMTYLIGLFGCIYKKAIGSRIFWRALSLFLILMLFILLAILLFMFLKYQSLLFLSIDMILNVALTIMMLPLIYALWSYGKPNNPAWLLFKNSEVEKHNNALFSSSKSVVASLISETQGKISVSILKQVKKYKVIIKTEINEFEVIEFNDINAALNHIETNYPIMARDFKPST